MNKHLAFLSLAFGLYLILSACESYEYENTGVYITPVVQIHRPDRSTTVVNALCGTIGILLGIYYLRKK